MFWFSRSSNSVPGQATCTHSVLKLSVRQKLQSELEEVAAQCPDFRQGKNGVIQDIIDPSLRVPRRTQEASSSSHHPLWIPAVFDVAHNKTCAIRSPINNIDHILHHNLYQSIAELFSACVGPLESCLGMQFTGTRLQVIVKAQKYLLKEGQSYAGDVHREGVPENHILGVCLYYYHINQVSGGALRLGGPAFERGYTASMEQSMASIAATENSLITFNNSQCFHKVDRMTGTAHNGERAFIAFFIIHPLRRIPDSLNDVTLNLHLIWIRELRYMARQAGVDLVEDVTRMIGHYLLQSWHDAVLERSRFNSNLVRTRLAMESSHPFRLHACNKD